MDAIKEFGERHPVIAGIAKGVVIVGGAIGAAVVHEAVSGNGSSGNGSSRSSTDYYPTSGHEDNYDSSLEPEDDYSEPSTERDYPDERSSPREHDVSGYDRQQNGKTVHVNPYKRGGKNKDDE